MNPIIEIAKQAAEGRPFAFAQTERGLGIVIEGEPGYNLFANVPANHAQRLNHEMGLTDEQALMIIASTMRQH